MAPLLGFWKSAKLFSNFSFSIPDLESKNCQVRHNVEKPVLACISVPSRLFHKCYEHPGLFPVFVNPWGVCLPGSVCTSAGISECRIYWCFQESTVLYLSPLSSHCFKNARVFFKFMTSYFLIWGLLSTTFSVLIWKLTGKLALFFAESLPS